MNNQGFRNEKGRSHGIYRTILMSYLAMLVIFSITGIVLMRQSENALMKEIFRANLASMNRMKNQLDSRLQNIEELCRGQALDSTITQFIYSQRRNDITTESKRHVDIVNIVRNMRSAVIANRFVDTLYLMTLQDGTMITNQGKYSLDEFFQTNYSGQDEMDASKFLAMNANTSYKQYEVIPPPITKSAPNHNSSNVMDRKKDLYFLYALPLGSEVKVAVLGVRINNAEIQSIIKDSEWLPGAHVVLLDEHNNIIDLSGSKDYPIAEAAPWDQIGSEEPFLWSYAGQQYFTLTVNSKVSPWRYGLVVPSNVYMQPWTSHMKVYILGLVLMLIVGVTMAIFMANIQYRPIRRLVNIATSKITKRHNSKNEFADIEQAFSDIVNENKELSELNQLQRELLRNQQLTGILYGSISDEYEIGEVIRGSGMPMRYSRYAFVLISDELADNKSANKAIEVVAQLLEKFPSEIDTLRIVTGQEECLLLNMPDNVTEEDLYRCCAAWANETDSRGRYQISISNPYEGAEGIHPAYLEAQEVREYQLSPGIAKVMSAGQLPGEEDAAQNDGSHAPDNKTDKEAVVTEAVALIQQRYADETLSVASIADEIGVSQVTLSRAFKQVLNIGALEFIHCMRLKIAKQLVTDTNINLLDIARQVGYTNNVTFIRVFKKYEGITPSQYRISHKAEPENASV